MFVEFNPTAYTVTEGVDDFAELTLVRRGYLAQSTTVTVTTLSGTATGMGFLSTLQFIVHHIIIQLGLISRRLHIL